MQNKEKNSKNKNKEKLPDIWQILEERKKRGLWDGEIKVHQIKEYSLSKGEHYFIISDNRKREVTCTSCSIKHGGILEAHMLNRYKVEDGVIYLDEKATNIAPKKALDNSIN